MKRGRMVTHGVVDSILSVSRNCKVASTVYTVVMDSRLVWFEPFTCKHVHLRTIKKILIGVLFPALISRTI